MNVGFALNAKKRFILILSFLKRRFYHGFHFCYLSFIWHSSVSDCRIPLLGSAWLVMYQELGTRCSSAGIISMIIAAGTIVSSLNSDRLNTRFGTGKSRQ